jgi:hypothetical protein
LLDLVVVERLVSPKSKDGVEEALVNKVEEAVEEASRPICRVAVGEVVPKPRLVPLSNSKELAVVVLPVYLTKKLLVPLPLSLLLKLVQSAARSWPVLEMEEKGRFKVKVLAEILPLKMLPVVPVAKVVTTLLDRVIWVEVPMRTF